MRPYLIGLLILTGAMAYSQETNMPGKIEEYLNPGAPIKVKTGRKFTIRMEANPTTTGYSWRLAKDLNNIIVLVTNTFIPPETDICGAGGHELWTFKAVCKGKAEIFMRYVRPWEKDLPAVTNVFTVIVD